MTNSGKRFRNAYPHASHTLLGVLRWKLGMAREETLSVQASEVSAKWIDPPASHGNPSVASAEEGIRLTWIGHSTFLLQYRGRNILTDPIFGDCRPLPIGGLKRLGPPGMTLDSLPPIHDVLISHSHYDHLDVPTIRALGRDVNYWVPSGLSGWFRKRGIRFCRELGWWESTSLADGMTIHSVPAQHGSARGPFDRDRTHWCGWVLQSSKRSIYFAGDSGYCPSFQEIGQRFGGFDLAMIPIGAYNPRWLMQPMHLNPAEAVQVHVDVASRLSIACHWGTFRLTDEPPNEPPALLAQELSARHMDLQSFRALRVGETIEV
ncbi:MAG: MBL fold metallo-hydrolase [Acidobacteriaceae bacterium]